MSSLTKTTRLDLSPVPVCEYGCIRFEERSSRCWLMHQHWKGWCSYSLCYPSLEWLMLCQQTRPVEPKRDQWGDYWTLTKGRTPQELWAVIHSNNGMNFSYPVVGTRGRVTLFCNWRTKCNELHFQAQGQDEHCVVSRHDLWLEPVPSPIGS